MKTEDIAVYKEVYSCKSFAKAADLLFVSRNTCMRIIDSMEKEFGCTFFIRTARGLKPTEAGEKFFQYLESTEHAYNMIKKELSESPEFDQINFGFSGYGADKFIASKCMKAFNEINKTSKVVGVQVPRGEAAQSLHNGTIDVLFSMLPPGRTEFATKRLITLEFVLLMNKNNPLTPPSRTLPADVVKDLPLIFTSFSKGPINVFENELKTDLSSSIVYETSDVGLIYQMVSDDDGAAVLITRDAKMGSALFDNTVVVSIEPKICCNLGLNYKPQFAEKHKEFIEYMTTHYCEEYYKD